MLVSVEAVDVEMVDGKVVTYPVSEILIPPVGGWAFVFFPFGGVVLAVHLFSVTKIRILARLSLNK